MGSLLMRSASVRGVRPHRSAWFTRSFPPASTSALACECTKIQAVMYHRKAECRHNAAGQRLLQLAAVNGFASTRPGGKQSAPSHFAWLCHAHSDPGVTPCD